MCKELDSQPAPAGGGFRMEQGSKLGLHGSGCRGRVWSVRKKVLAAIRIENNCSVCLFLVPKDPLEGAGAALFCPQGSKICPKP